MAAILDSTIIEHFHYHRELYGTVLVRASGELQIVPYGWNNNRCVGQGRQKDRELVLVLVAVRGHLGISNGDDSSVEVALGREDWRQGG